MSDAIQKKNLIVAAAIAAAIGVAAVVGFAVGRGGSEARGGGEAGEVAAVDELGESPLAPETAPTRPRASSPRRAAAAAPAVTATAPAAEEPGNTAPGAIAGEPVASPAPAAPAPAPMEVAAGTRVELVLVEGVSSQSAQVGDRVAAELAAPIRVEGEIAVPSGTPVIGRVTEAHALAKVGGRARLALAFESIELAGESLPIAAFFAREGKSETGKDAATIAAGAAVGTVLGNQAKKNDRGKVIGAILGAGVGTAIAAKTEGETIELPAGARLELTLRDAVTVHPRG